MFPHTVLRQSARIHAAAEGRPLPNERNIVTPGEAGRPPGRAEHNRGKLPTRRKAARTQARTRPTTVTEKTCYKCSAMMRLLLRPSVRHPAESRTSRMRAVTRRRCARLCSFFVFSFCSVFVFFIHHTILSHRPSESSWPASLHLAGNVVLDVSEEHALHRRGDCVIPLAPSATRIACASLAMTQRMAPMATDNWYPPPWVSSSMTDIAV